MSVIGFDIGNENCCIAAVKAGGIEILDNEYSLRYTPTYIAFSETSRDIGVSARTKVVTNLENTAFGFKRILGKRYQDSGSQEEFAYIPHEICELPSGNIGIKVNYLRNNVVFSVEQLIAMILTKLKTISESKLGNKIRDCVIAVPPYFTDSQRRAMLDAISISGLNALKLINESAAVALSYGFFKQNLPEQEFKNVIFVDLGNSTLTVTACAFSKDKGRVLGCVWDYVGGRDFDNKLVEYFIDDFKRKYNVVATGNKKAIMTLVLECEKLKKVMSANSREVEFHIECFLHCDDVKGIMKRELFEVISEHVLDRIEITLRGIFAVTQLKPNDIHSVEIVGGSSRLPAVKQLIRKVFQCEPNATLNQDEAVARGCALQCAILSPLLKTRNFVLDDIPSYEIKIVWKNLESLEEQLEVFSFSDKIPSYKLITISMSKPFSLEACYVESSSKICKIGTFSFGNVPKSAEDSGFMKVKIKACLNIHGIFTLSSAKMLDRNAAEQSAKGVNEDKKVDFLGFDDEESLSSPEQLAQDVKASCVVKSYDLTINSDVPGLTKIRLTEYIDAEQQMICRDIEAKEKADAFNALEEYIYDVRNKLNFELEEFVLEKDKTRLFQSLHDTENWMYDNEKLEAADYSKMLRELKISSDPIFKRRDEWKQRSSVIDRYLQVLQQSFDVVTHLENEKPANILPEDIQNLYKVCQNSKDALDQSIQRFSKMKKSDDVPVTAEALQKSLENFQTEFQNSVSEVKRKMDSAQELTQTPSSGDGLSEKPQNVAPNYESKESEEKEGKDISANMEQVD